MKKMGKLRDQYNMKEEEQVFLAEKLILGNTVSKMNDLGAGILFNHNMNNLKDFQIQFKKANKD